MADYGNYFTGNSNNYYYKTNGHNYNDSDWVIVRPTTTVYTTGIETYFVGWPDNPGAESFSNNCTTYPNKGITIYTRAATYNYYTYINDKNEYVAYYIWDTNRNVTGSIQGEFTCYPFNDKNSSKMVEPTEIDDKTNGVSPYSNNNDNALTRTSLKVIGTQSTAGYRRYKIRHFPEVHRNINSYDNGNITHLGNFQGIEDLSTRPGDSSNKDYSYIDCQETINVDTYGAFQTFYNEVDPYAVLNVSVSNHDNAKSSSPVFCTLRNNKSEYRINHSYSYNPYINSATWNNTNYLSFTYNTLPTYPKSLVFTYSNNWNGVSYDGANINIEAKAWYNNSYDRFTTSTANDDGFTSYKRYVDVTYYLTVHHSSTLPSGINTYTFRIWQPGSKLRISYSWSIDNNPTWATLSTTTGNKTTVTIEDQGDYKGTISGKLKITCDTSGYTENTYNGTIDGVTFKDKDNKSARSCTIRQNMTVTNCSAQNITPKDTKGQPYRTLTLTQKPAVWETPKFNITVKVTQDGKTNSPTTDLLDYEWPTFIFGDHEFTPTSSNTAGISNNIVVNGKGWPWVLGIESKVFSIKYPKIEDKYTKSDCTGTANCVIESGNISNTGGSKTITITPNITFKKKRYEGFSTRKWTIKCVSVNPTVALDNNLSGFDNKQFTMNGIAKHDYGSGIVTFDFSGATTTSSPWSVNITSRTISASSKPNDETLDGNNDETYERTFTITAKANNKVSGTWSASASSGKIEISSTSKNKGSRKLAWSISGTPSENGKIIMTGNSGYLVQNGDTWDGTITVTGSGKGLKSCSTSISYPANIDGNAMATGYYSLESPKQRYLAGPGSMKCSGYWSNDYIYIKRDSDPDFDADRNLPYKIIVTSNIQGKYPTNASDGVILNGTVNDYAPSITTKYKLDGATSWSTTNNKKVGDGRTWHKKVEPSVIRNSETNETKGIYNTVDGTVGYYDSRSWSGSIIVIDDHNKDKTATASCTITHAGTPASAIDANFTFTVTPFNCSVENVSTETRGNNLPTFNYKANSQSDGGTHQKETSTSGSITKQTWADTGSNTMNIGSGNLNDSVEDIETKYDNYEYGPSYSSSTWTQRETGYIDHYYDWYYGVTISASDKSETFENKGGSSSWRENPSSNTTIYYLFVKWSGESKYHTNNLHRNASQIDATFRKQHKTFSDSWDWQVAKSDGTDIQASGNGSISITFTNSTAYKLIVVISGATNISCFDTGWTFSTNVTAWHKNSGDTEWTQDNTPSITYSWSGAGSGSNSKCSIDIANGPAMGSNADSIGSTSAVTVTVSASGYGTATDTVNIGVYGKSYYNG